MVIAKNKIEKFFRFGGQSGSIWDQNFSRWGQDFCVNRLINSSLLTFADLVNVNRWQNTYKLKAHFFSNNLLVWDFESRLVVYQSDV